MSLNQLLTGAPADKKWCKITANSITTPGIVSDDAKVVTSLPTAIIGSNGSTSAAAGYVGEYLEGKVTAGDIKADTFTNAATITLSPGDWDLSAMLVSQSSGIGTTVEFILCISDSAVQDGNDPSDYKIGINANIRDTASAPFVGDITTVIPRYRKLVTANTPMYLKAYFNVGAVGTKVLGGILSARRIR